MEQPQLVACWSNDMQPVINLLAGFLALVLFNKIQLEFNQIENVPHVDAELKLRLAPTMSDCVSLSSSARQRSLLSIISLSDWHLN